MTFKEMENMGVYFTTPAIGFTIPYLKRLRLSFFYARTAPGQEAFVNLDFLNDDTDFDLDITHMSLRDHLLHALEGVSIAMLEPDRRIPFDVEYPSKLQFSDRGVLGFGRPSGVVKHLAFDGHFGVNRSLESGVDVRTANPVGRPRKKSIPDYVRSVGCAHKDRERATLPNRTGGWQFVCDARTGSVLAGYEHIDNERCIDKHLAIQGTKTMYKIKPASLTHDDNCTFEKWVKKNHPEDYKDVKDFVVDHFHKKNHVCQKKRWTRRQKRLLKGINTSCCEQFHAFLRRFNFFLNSLRPSSHRFWVSAVAKFYNKKKDKIRGGPVPRRTVKNRMLKRPSRTR